MKSIIDMARPSPAPSRQDSTSESDSCHAESRSPATASARQGTKAIRTAAPPTWHGRCRCASPQTGRLSRHGEAKGGDMPAETAMQCPRPRCPCARSSAIRLASSAARGCKARGRGKRHEDIVCARKGLGQAHILAWAVGETMQQDDAAIGRCAVGQHLPAGRSPARCAQCGLRRPRRQPRIIRCGIGRRDAGQRRLVRRRR